MSAKGGKKDCIGGKKHPQYPLDYYSGLKADCEDLLELTLERMEEAYEGFIEDINNTDLSFDTRFEIRRTIIDTITEKNLDKLSKRRETEEEKEQKYNQQLTQSDSEDTRKIKSKRDELTFLDELQRIWIVVAKVLKNTEESKKPMLKEKALTEVTKSCMAFSYIYKSLVDQYLKKQTDIDASNDQIRILSRFLPAINQVVLFQEVGTGKLSMVLREKIEQVLTDQSVSDYEKFLYVFMYSDLDGDDKIKFIKQLIGEAKRHYTKDMVFVKLMGYFFSENLTPYDEKQYKSLLGDLKSKEIGGNRNAKGVFISRLEDAKNKKQLVTQ